MLDVTRMGGTRLIMHMKTVMFRRTAAPVGLMTLLWLLSTLMILSSSHAAIFFDSDFELEGGNDWAANGWNDFGLAPAPGTFMSMTNQQAFTGARSLSLAYDNINGSTQRPSIYRNIPAGTKHIFVRFAFRLDPAFQLSSNGGTKLIRWRATDGYPILWINNKWNSYAFDMEGPYDRTGNWILYCGRVPSRTSWDQVEIEYKLNDPGVSNGLLRMWVNGTLCVESLNHQFIGPTPTSVGLSGLSNPSTSTLLTTQVYLQSGNGKMFYDRLAIGNTRIGPTKSTSTSADSTAPASPQGLRAY